jgi:hypothetical protein
MTPESQTFLDQGSPPSSAGAEDATASDLEVLDADAVASICKAARETTIAKMNEGMLPGVKIGREWICTRAALLAELTRLSLANVERKESPAITRTAPKTLPASTRQVVPHQPPARPGKRRNVPPVLPPFPGDQIASPTWKA